MKTGVFTTQEEKSYKSSFQTVIYQMQLQCLVSSSNLSISLRLSPFNKIATNFSNIIPTQGLLLFFCGKTLSWRGKPPWIWAESIFPTNPETRPGPFFGIYVNVSFARRRQHVGYQSEQKSTEKDVKKTRQSAQASQFESLMARIMRKTGVHVRADRQKPGRAQYQCCWKNTMPSLIWCPLTCRRTIRRLMSHQAN